MDNLKVHMLDCLNLDQCLGSTQTFHCISFCFPFKREKRKKSEIDLNQRDLAISVLETQETINST